MDEQNKTKTQEEQENRFKGINYHARKEDCTPEEWEKIREYKRIKAAEYREKHRAKYNKYIRKYEHKHKDKRREIAKRYRDSQKNKPLLEIFLQREQQLKEMLKSDPELRQAYERITKNEQGN